MGQNCQHEIMRKGFKGCCQQMAIDRQSIRYRQSEDVFHLIDRIGETDMINSRLKQTIVVEGYAKQLQQCENDQDILNFLEDVTDKMLSSHIQNTNMGYTNSQIMGSLKERVESTAIKLTIRKQLFDNNSQNYNRSSQKKSEIAQKSNKQNITTNQYNYNSVEKQKQNYHQQYSKENSPFSDMQSLKQISIKKTPQQQQKWSDFIDSMSPNKFMHSNQHKQTQSNNQTPNKHQNNINYFPSNFHAKANAQIPDGIKQLHFINGDLLVGDLTNGICQGHGRYIKIDGGYYEGEFVNGRAEGYGIYVDITGYIYEGNWENNYPNGNGKIKYSDGSSYRGLVRYGQLQGKGLLNRDQYIYDGQFVDGLFHGRGKMLLNNGEIYDGQWRSGKKQGYGQYSWGNGDKYFGYFKNQLKDGFGTMVYHNGEYYKGEWKLSMKDGEGCFNSSHKTYSDKWKHSKLIGSNHIK